MGLKRSRLVLPHKEYQALCRDVRRRDNNKCRVCKSRNTLHHHHIVYRSHQGDDMMENLVVLCNGCHEALHHGHLLLLPPEGIPDGFRPGVSPVDANGPIKFMFLNGWKPRRKL